MNDFKFIDTQVSWSIKGKIKVEFANWATGQTIGKRHKRKNWFQEKNVWLPKPWREKEARILSQFDKRWTCSKVLQEVSSLAHWAL